MTKKKCIRIKTVDFSSVSINERSTDDERYGLGLSLLVYPQIFEKIFTEAIFNLGIPLTILFTSTTFKISKLFVPVFNIYF